MTQTMPLSSMTFHESYGDIPRAMLALYRRFGVSVADHDRMVLVLGGTDWEAIYNLVQTHSHNGYLALPMFF